MPNDALLLSLAVVFVFTVFAAALAWADYTTTTRHSRTQAAEASTDRLVKPA